MLSPKGRNREVLIKRHLQVTNPTISPSTKFLLFELFSSLIKSESKLERIKIDLAQPRFNYDKVFRILAIDCDSRIDDSNVHSELNY